MIVDSYLRVNKVAVHDLQATLFGVAELGHLVLGEPYEANIAWRDTNFRGQVAGSHYHQAFHDVTAGPANTAEFPTRRSPATGAGPGWDPVTGWGSPNAQVLVPVLASAAGHDLALASLGRAFGVAGRGE